MASRSRQLAKLLDAGGDVKSEALDNVAISDAVDEVVQVTTSSNTSSSFVVDSISVNEIKAVTFSVTAFSNSDYQFTTISVVIIDSGSDCVYNEYGTMQSTELSTFDVRIVENYLELVADPVSSGINFNISRISVDS